MKNRKWQGAALYLAILAASSGAYALRVQASTDQLSSTPATATTSTSSSTTKAKAASTSGASPAPSKASSAPTVQTIKGATEQTPYGPVQVSVTFSGTSITEVTTLQTPNGDGRSVSIAQRSVPTLHDEVIASQSAQIDTVSGATYTSDGYAQSVQSAIDKLGH